MTPTEQVFEIIEKVKALQEEIKSLPVFECITDNFVGNIQYEARELLNELTKLEKAYESICDSPEFVVSSAFHEKREFEEVVKAVVDEYKVDIKMLPLMNYSMCLVKGKLSFDILRKELAKKGLSFCYSVEE